MKRAIAAAVICVMPMAAQSLSCMPHTVETAFQRAQEEPARFIIVKGTLDFDEKGLPRVDYDNQAAAPPMTRITATLEGQSLSQAGFKTPYAREVALQVACFGPWCGSAQSGEEVLAFVELADGRDIVESDPCGGYLFTAPTAKMLKAVKRCFAGGACTPLR